MMKLAVPTALALVAGALVAPVMTVSAMSARAAEVDVRLTTSTARFYPPVDGYRDVARFRVTIDRTADVTLQVRPSKGAPTVRSVELGSLPSGRHAGSWDGRAEGGAFVDPGRYVVRAVAREPGHPVQRSPYVVVRMGWKVLAEQSSTSNVTANSYHKVTGECGHLDQLAGNRVRFDMDAPADCPKGLSGGLDAHYRFAQYPAGFSDPERVIDPHVHVRANGNHACRPGRLRHARPRDLAGPRAGGGQRVGVVLRPVERRRRRRPDRHRAEPPPAHHPPRPVHLRRIDRQRLRARRVRRHADLEDAGARGLTPPGPRG